MFKRNTFTVSKEVEIEVTIDDVIENVDANELFEALMQEGSVDASTIIGDLECDEVLDNFQHYEVISWAVTNLDTSDVLDAFKDSDPDGMHEWLKANDDIVNPDKVEEPKPEPIPLKHPFVSMTEGRLLVDGQDAGTYKVFGGVIAVDAFNVQFMANTVDNASKILNAIAFASVNLSEV